jgi:hypothetical protein
VALALALIWLGHHRRIFAPGLFALYVAGYSAFRIFEESLRVDSSAHFLGLRLNMYVACVLTVAGLTWFVLVQRRGRKLAAAGKAAPELAAGGAQPSQVGATDSDGALTEAIVPGGATAEEVPAAADGAPDEAAASAGKAADEEPATADEEPSTSDEEPETARAADQEPANADRTTDREPDGSAKDDAKDTAAQTG